LWSGITRRALSCPPCMVGRYFWPVPNTILEIDERNKRCGSTPLPSTSYFYYNQICCFVNRKNGLRPMFDKIKEVVKLYKEYEHIKKRKAEIENRLSKIDIIFRDSQTDIIIENAHEHDDINGLSPDDAYKFLAKIYFEGKPFRSHEIRNIATAMGLRIKDEPIKDSYHRVIMSRLSEESDEGAGDNYLIRIEPGIYQYNYNKKEESKEAIPRRKKRRRRIEK